MFNKIKIVALLIIIMYLGMLVIGLMVTAGHNNSVAKHAIAWATREHRINQSLRAQRWADSVLHQIKHK